MTFTRLCRARFYINILHGMSVIRVAKGLDNILFDILVWSIRLEMFTRLCILPGGRVLPYMGYTGTCRWTGYGFWPLCPEQGI